ncbi:MAG: alpha/beta hydrolase [Chloroflexota bacterium]
MESKRPDWFKWGVAAGISAFSTMLVATSIQRYRTQQEQRNLTPLGKLVSLNGRQWHLISPSKPNGNQSPTVIVESGMGGYSADWLRVLWQIGEEAAIYVYDRPGYGWSDPSPSPPTAIQIAQDLKRLLDSEGITQPAIFVGHSYGALATRAFVHFYPEQVLGAVFVDSAHESIYQRLPSRLRFLLNQVSWLKVFAILGARLGIVRLLARATAEIDRTRYPGEIFVQYPPEMRQFLITPRCWTNYTQTLFRELESFQTSCEQIAALRLENDVVFGNKPLAIVMASTKRSAERFQQAVPFPAESYDREWRAMQMDLLALSTNSRFSVAEESGHLVMAEQPTAIVEAIRWVVQHC